MISLVTNAECLFRRFPSAGLESKPHTNTLKHVLSLTWWEASWNLLAGQAPEKLVCYHHVSRFPDIFPENPLIEGLPTNLIPCESADLQFWKFRLLEDPI